MFGKHSDTIRLISFGFPDRALHLVSEQGFYIGRSQYIGMPIKWQVVNFKQKLKTTLLIFYNLNDNNLYARNMET